ncbi:MAG: TetR/AcrR family transcriptional regulator [Sneathiella sp.]
MEEGGLLDLTTNQIAERAGVSIGTLYQYFPTKEVILAEVSLNLRRSLLQNISRIIHGNSTKSLDEIMDILVKVAIDRLFDRPQLARALEYADAYLPLDEEVAALTEQFEAEIAGLLERHGIATPVLAGRNINAIARGMVDAASAAGETDRQALLVRIGRALRGYLAYSGDSE